MSSIYSSVLDVSASRFKEQLLKDFEDPSFDWNKLIKLILEEDSPLQDVLSVKTLHLAGLFEAAQKVFQSASELEEMENNE